MIGMLRIKTEVTRVNHNNEVITKLVGVANIPCYEEEAKEHYIQWCDLNPRLANYSKAVFEVYPIDIERS